MVISFPHTHHRDDHLSPYTAKAPLSGKLLSPRDDVKFPDIKLNGSNKISSAKRPSAYVEVYRNADNQR
jgi:hypothetical protein